ncbi:hypothetical protein L6452_01278 [Arctium lappa]|uniref:Uncharacterized protein n=1 Tax=Arctium lappa TaxID=4217 RepID=A0ACB9FH51_ARCLA|nr:hypothetical protein L6452_01278 [Arctium lappa]
MPYLVRMEGDSMPDMTSTKQTAKKILLESLVLRKFKRAATLWSCAGEGRFEARGNMQKTDNNRDILKEQMDTSGIKDSGKEKEIPLEFLELRGRIEKSFGPDFQLYLVEGSRDEIGS